MTPRSGIGLASALALSLSLAAPQATATPTHAPFDDRGWDGQPQTMPKAPVMTGSGGAVASVDRDASQIGLDVLARGGNAADAAIATAAAPGVTEPHSAGIGRRGLPVY